MRKRSEYEAMVKGPGKYEGEEPYVPYLWEEVVMEGFSEIDEDGNDVVEVSDLDFFTFPELKGRKYVVLHEWDDGFVVEIK
jgi:hypothetical protein